MKSIIKFTLVVLLFVPAFSLETFAAAGDLDPGFGTGGKVLTTIGGEDQLVNGVAAQPDGKVIVVGTTVNQFQPKMIVVRYNSNGTPDTGFGTNGNGIIIFNMPSSIAGAVSLQTDGKILIGGASAGDFAIVRLNTDGSFDNSFGINGVAVTDFRPGNPSGDSIFAMAVQADGKIVTGGSTDAGTNIDFALARFNTDGTLDTSYGTNGRVITPVGPVTDTIFALKLQPDGKAVAAGFQQTNGANNCALARYNTNGSLDGSFGTGGKVITNISSGNFVNNDELYSVAIQADGKIVAAGHSADNDHNYFALARYNTNGSLDAGFGGGGITLTPVGESNGLAGAIVPLPDGGFIAAGYGETSGFSRAFTLARYNSAGLQDMFFGDGGLVQTHIANGPDDGFVATLQGSRLVVAGRSYNGSEMEVGLARYQLLAPTAAEVSIGGRVTSSFGSGVGKVSVTLVNVQTGETNYALTNQLGYYNFSQRPIGTYVISVSAKGRWFAPETMLINANADMTEQNFQEASARSLFK
jgi:uncharacterized delta-60 repeat protein